MTIQSPVEVVDAVLARNLDNPTRLVQILREVQEALGWLPTEVLAMTARGIRQPLARVQGVAGFYSFFHTRPMGRYRVLWSDNITDRMLGSSTLMNEMCQKLWLEPGRVSEDGLASVDVTSCTGMCDQGPAILVNYRAITRLDSQRVTDIVELIRGNTALNDWPREFFRIDDNIRRRDVLLGNAFQRGAALRSAVQQNPAALLEEIKISNLR